MTPARQAEEQAENRLGNPRRKIKDVLRWKKLLGRLKEIREKLRDLKGDLGEKAKKLIEKLKEKAKDYWNKLLEKLKPEKRSVEEFLAADDDIKTELGKKLRERFEEILENRGCHRKGKTVKEDYLEEIQRQVEGNWEVELGEKPRTHRAF
ncbi:hypothetical protein NPIL_598171 [Nephila pilipes]|uniref:Uncharacterized protein n=1 Tax=Nephila pilipes TaxID=299642 RepID=A0A8X6TVZ0_NEPPI|nr:hypothetical protein NPIL_598171 [Nephila pilipes]